MGRKPVNTVKRTVSMHPDIIKEVREYTKKRTDEELKKESINFTFTNPKDFENGCFVDPNNIKDHWDEIMEVQNRKENFMEYYNMWNKNKKI